MSRNEAEDIQWRLDFNDVRKYARSIGTTWQQLIQKGITECRIRRGQTYLCGAKITYISRDRSASGDYLDIKARGFLDLFADRMTGPAESFSLQRCGIAATLIAETQGIGPGWDFGVQVNLVPASPVYTRTYQNVVIKDAIQALTKLQAGFDFQFTPDRLFNMYTPLGTVRNDIIFRYPGNCTRLTSIGDATSIQNRLYLLGAGIGQDAMVQITKEDLSSQANFNVREKSIILNDILDSGTLDDYGQSHLAAWGTPFEIPGVEYDGSVGPTITDFGIGDYVQVYETDDPGTEIKGSYRVEQIAISLDDKDTETIKILFGR
jgi:hypothetical protein